MTWRGHGYELRFRPSVVSDRIISIQRLSFRLRYSLSSLWISSITITFRSSIEWCGREKCLATGFSILRCLMSDRWPVKQTRSAFSVSPTYWMAHRLHSIKYTTLLVPQSAVAFTQNRAPVVVLLNMVPVFICAHALQRGCLHGLFPFRRGHFGSASFKRGGGGNMSRTHWWLWRMRVRWGRFGWNVTTSGVTCSLSFLDRGINSWSHDILIAFSIPRCTISPSWPRLIKCFLSSATRC